MLYLSRKLNGTYQLTVKPPTKAVLDAVEKYDMYVTPGDSFNVQGLCEAAVKMLFDVELQPCEMTRVELIGSGSRRYKRLKEKESASGVMVAT